MKPDKAIAGAQDAERELAKELRRSASATPSSTTSTTSRTRWHAGAKAHLNRLSPFAERYGADTDIGDVGETPPALERMRHKTAELVGRSETTGMLLLHDLRNL